MLLAAAIPSANLAVAEPYLIIATQEKLPEGLSEAVALAGGVLVSDAPQIGVAAAESSEPGFAAQLEGTQGIRSVVPNVQIQLIDPEQAPSSFRQGSSAVTQDSLSYLQWNLEAIDAYGAWGTGATGEGVLVAILDTGIDYTHPDLAPNYAGGQSFVPFNLVNPSNPTDPMDDHFHRTHVAGIIAAADNGIGIACVAPKAKLLAVKVLSGYKWGLTDWLFSGIVYAADEGADIINMSL